MKKRTVDPIGNPTKNCDVMLNFQAKKKGERRAELTCPPPLDSGLLGGLLTEDKVSRLLGLRCSDDN